MVRFARAEGSKGSNKRQLEEPTPWLEMVEQLNMNSKKKKSNKDLGNERNYDTLEQTTRKKKGKTDAGNQNIKVQNIAQHVEELKSEANKKGKNELDQTTQNLVGNRKKKKKGSKPTEPEYTITSEGKRVKVFRDGTQRTWFDLPYEESDLMTRYEGMWVKQEMVSELDHLKTTLEEEGLDKTEMMRKMMKAKRKAHRQLRIELIYQQKKIVSEATGEEVKDDTTSRSKEKNKNGGVNSKKKNRKQKTATMKNYSLISQKKVKHVRTDKSECNLEDVNSNEIFGTVKQMESCSEREEKEETFGTVEEMEDCSKSEEKGDMKGLDTNQTNVKGKEENIDCTVIKVKKNNSQEKDQIENHTRQLRTDTEKNYKHEDQVVTQTQQDDKVEKKQISKKKRLKTEQAALQIDVEKDTKGDDGMMMTEADVKVKKKNIDCELEEATVLQISEQSGNIQGTEAEDCNSFLRKNLVQSHNFKTTVNPNSQCNLEENELMTNYDGYWVLREDVESLEAAKKIELEALYAARTDGTAKHEKELSEEEQITLQRAMKKKKRVLHRQLLSKLSKMGKTVGDGGKKKENDDKGKVKKNDSDKVVKFDGFWVKKEAADRLHKLRKKLFKEGLSQKEVDSLVQKERRKEERVLKNERKLVCLNCRQPGHMVSACPNILQVEGEGQPSICYTCGSTEHTSSTCNLKKGSEKSFSFAICYICKESGHISRQCPDNPRGLYPKGGACRGCGSVEHLAKDCPDLQKEKGECSIKVGRLKGEELEVLDTEEDIANEEDAAPSHIKQSIPKVVKF